MKLKDILTTETWNKYGDMDVTNDCIDDMACAWCGTTLTREGEEHFAEALNLEAEIRPVWGYDGISVKINHLEKYGRAWRKTKELFDAMAGYCSESNYAKWFDDHTEDPVPERTKEDLDKMCGVLANFILENVYKVSMGADELRPVLERAGFTDREIEDFLRSGR